jgi:hypothetical protein
MKPIKKDLSVAQLKRLSVPKALALIQSHYGFGRMTAEQFYGFLMSGGDVAGQDARPPHRKKPAKT